MMDIETNTPEDLEAENDLIASIAASWSEYMHLHSRRLSPDMRLRTIECMERAVRYLADSERTQAGFRSRAARGEAHLLEGVA
ncbi:hypothetical protein [Acetobacter lambici]|uniref:Uncharacterized protein n=1 Tax=Acetobacter lambici TaxID=1332824 RepID=A0ABT1EZY6_9PROT|nr:hypothetical protein [Acetobacter lambici]MCP1243008.1 hypothetical protein [Acetobacter lambici]MCP1258518.1 hypothetical protein [Acetobacter lambici]